MTNRTSSPGVGVVIPTLNEQHTISRALDSVPATWTAVVVDGGSTDQTLRIAREHGTPTLVSARRRATQMNCGAQALIEQGTHTLVFLHADGRLPPDAASIIEKSMSDANVVGGAFSLAIDGTGVTLRIIAWMANARSRYWKLPYGDQGIYCRVASFQACGGYPEIPLMEDVALIRRLRRLGEIRIADASVHNLDRHWSRLGPVLTTVVNWTAITLYNLGVPANRIAPLYARLRRQHSPASRPTTKATTGT